MRFELNSFLIKSLMLYQRSEAFERVTLTAVILIFVILIRKKCISADSLVRKGFEPLLNGL